MPANKKYLTTSNWIKFSKISATILGAMLASVTLHLALAIWVGFEYIIPTSLFSVFILWGFFMIMVYWIKSPWKSWGIFLFIISISVAGIYMAKN
ncbi:hypothetical protein [Aquimarina aquimarini]|uniref:hypothetical protein n=1 Tax=Aquimarina aquimarini TaxID=1191734 RepID=UPI000D550EF7|nr:hypothetical protein [Aquimarina aquimarini]